MTDHHARLAELLAERGNALLATATLLTGRRDAGEDLLQHALERVLRRGSTVSGDPEGYLRRTMYNLSADRWRRLARLKEVLGTDAEPMVEDHSDRVELQHLLSRVLASLPARQRTVIVLRYYEQFSEAETARVLGISTGTVKSSSSRALRRMREVLDNGDGMNLVTCSAGVRTHRPTTTEE